MNTTHLISTVPKLSALVVLGAPCQNASAEICLVDRSRNEGINLLGHEIRPVGVREAGIAPGITAGAWCTAQGAAINATPKTEAESGPFALKASPLGRALSRQKQAGQARSCNPVLGLSAREEKPALAAIAQLKEGLPILAPECRSGEPIDGANRKISGIDVWTSIS